MENNNCFSVDETLERVQDERYIVEEFIGEGGMACVYRARESGTPNVYALKLLKEQYRQREEFVGFFQNEAVHMRDLQHPNIVRFYKMVVEEKSAYILMDYIDGNPLTKYIQRARATENPFPIDEIVRIMTQIARAIAHLHSEGFIHRDVKPGNVLLAKADGKAYLTDLGIAGTQDSEFALSGAGTPSYMPFEQQAAGHKVDHTVDIYAFAVMIFEMFTGEKPFRAPTGIEYDEARKILQGLHQSAPVPNVTEFRPDLPHELNIIFRKALAKNPADRYRNVISFVKDIHLILLPMLSPDLHDIESIEARVMPDMQAIRAAQGLERQRRNLLWRGGTAIVVILLIVAGAIAFLYNLNTPAVTAALTETVSSATEALVLTNNAQTIAVAVNETNTMAATATPIVEYTATATTTPTLENTSTELPPSSTDVPSPTATGTQTPTPSITPTMASMMLVSGADAIGLNALNTNLDDVISYAIQQDIAPIPLRLGADVNGFRITIGWRDVGNATKYGIAFRMQDAGNFLLLSVDAQAKTWQVEAVNQVDDEDVDNTVEATTVVEPRIIDGDLPDLLTISGVDDSYIATVGDDTISFNYDFAMMGGAGVYLQVADNTDVASFPVISQVEIELQDADAIVAQSAVPTPMPFQLDPRLLFIQDVALLNDALDISANLSCDVYTRLYHNLEDHQTIIVAIFAEQELADDIEPILEEGAVFISRCVDAGIGGELDLSNSVNSRDSLDLEQALQTFLDANR